MGPLPQGHAWHRHEHSRPDCLCAQARADTPSHRDPALPEMYALVRSEALLEGRLNGLTHQVSRASLLEPCLGLSSPLLPFQEAAWPLPQSSQSSLVEPALPSVKVAACLKPAA